MEGFNIRAELGHKTLKGKRNLVVLSNWGCEDFIKDLYDNVAVLYDPDEITKDDLLVLEGGTDISPSFYREQKGKWTQTPDVLRDKIEWKALNLFVNKGASILGICRGAQLVTAYVGGKVVQHVTGHNRNKGHGIITKDGQTLWASSLHHQMMYPFHLKDDEYEIIAHTPHNLSKTYLDGLDREYFPKQAFPFVEPEIIWYPKVRALAIQGHPEFMPYESKFVQHCRNLVEEKLLNG